ncbi:MAG: TrkH family potassium uptake protein [Clostridia bacterium]|nr:TrkH family potassium uptake protein [Clostridia bacterium]
MKLKKLKNWSTTRLLAMGFALIIIVGSILLMLPISNKNGQFSNYIDALFTATSATCVTGLIVFDTYTQFTLFGQIIILLLIQVGGLGFISVSALFMFVTRQKIGLRQRFLLADGVGSLELTGVVRMARRILLGTAIFEGTGALILSTRFIPRLGLWQGIWASIFHSVSAFCNAGFDILGQLAPFSSLTLFSHDPVVILTIALLIIIGGIGFIVWSNLVDCKFNIKKISFHSKTVIISTLSLIIIGTFGYLFTEKTATMLDMNVGDRLLSSFFMSVTPRTAGFNSVDISALSGGGQLLTMILMFIGAAPCSTGGGIKVTTFVIIMAMSVSSLRNKQDVSLGNHRIDEKVLRHALCSVVIYFTMTVLGVFILSLQNINILDAMFECISAIGTVGLTNGITPTLPILSRLVIIILMYIGRLGSLTLFLAMVNKNNASNEYKNPIGKVLVG